jgi:hypothetical protein
MLPLRGCVSGIAAMARKNPTILPLVIALNVLAAACTPIAAQVQPANPSFASLEDKDLLALDLGAIKQGAPNKMFSVPLANLAAPVGTTSPMTLVSTESQGASAAIVLQPGTIDGMAAGSSMLIPLVLKTGQRGNLQASYVLNFGSDALPAAPLQQIVLSTFATVFSRGDYNYDGVVNGADYVRWRKTQGEGVAVGTGADGDFNGLINSGDYTVWRSLFGQTLSAATGGSADETALLSANVPEPSSFLLALTALWLVRQILPRRSIRRLVW